MGKSLYIAEKPSGQEFAKALHVNSVRKTVIWRARILW